LCGKSSLFSCNKLSSRNALLSVSNHGLTARYTQQSEGDKDRGDSRPRLYPFWPVKLVSLLGIGFAVVGVLVGTGRSPFIGGALLLCGVLMFLAAARASIVGYWGV
jgi:hypothetical protein